MAQFSVGANTRGLCCTARPRLPAAARGLAQTLDLTKHLPWQSSACLQYVRDVHYGVLSIYETLTFAADADRIWSEDERLAFFAWIATEADAGAVIPRSGGCRKVRWSRPGMGKQGGARVIYFTRLHAGELCMLLVCPKSEKDDIPAHILREIRKELEDGLS